MSFDTVLAFPETVRYGLVVRIPGSHPGGPGSIPGNGNCFKNFDEDGIEPTGLAVQRLNNSATPFVSQSAAQKVFPRRELNPGLLGESQIY